MTDTDLRGIPQWVWIALATVAAFSASRPALAESPRSRVVWVRADHAYVALAEHAAEGDSVRFEDRGKPIAGGHVATVVHDEMALVAITSGTLEKTKKLDRVRVLVSQLPVERRAVLRIGLPSGDNLLFRCGDVTPRIPASAPPYQSERLDGHRMRMTRDSIPSSIWPDTLHVFLFYDPLDEEIALERGELDVAIFWPGELSRRIREDVRWRGFPVGRRSHGVLAISGNSGVKASGDVEFRSGPLARLAPDSSAAESFNQEFFRGDLSLLHPGTGQWTLFPRGIGADARMPGHDVLRKRLQLGPDDMANRGPSHRLLYVEASPDTAATSTFIPLFRVACPVVCVPSLRPLVNALGADAFADMSQCSQERAEESRR